MRILKDKFRALNNTEGNQKNGRMTIVATIKINRDLQGTQHIAAWKFNFTTYLYILMKLFTFIMSFWLLYLSCLPCSDWVGYAGNSQDATLITVNHQQHKNETEHCTPFCTCSCCATPVFIQSTPYYTLHKQVFIKKAYPGYTTPFCGDISFTIWQPPKLS